MARDFSADVANYMSLGANALGPLLNGAASISVHGWVTHDTFTGATNGRDWFSVLINGNTSGLAITSIDVAAGGTKIRAGGRSTTADTFRNQDGTTVLSTGTQYAIGVAFQISADNIVIYLNGASDGSGLSGTWANAAYTNGAPTGHDSLGATFSGSAPISATRQLDGRLSEVGIWNGDIGAAGFAMLGQRVSPLLVRPELLVAYFPLVGQYSPEIDLVGAIPGTITGAVAADVHPSVYRPSATYSFLGAAVVAGYTPDVAALSTFGHAASLQSQINMPDEL